MCVPYYYESSNSVKEGFVFRVWDEFVGVFLGVDYEEGGIIFDDFVVIVSDDHFSYFAREKDFYRGKKIGILKYGMDLFKFRIIS